MKMSKKLLAICLALSLMVSMFAVLGTLTASAVGTEASGRRELDGDCTYWYSDEAVSTYTSGTGTVDDPYIVTTAAQLRHLARGDMGGGGTYYKLGCDIAINDSTNPYWYEESGLKNWIKGTDDTYGTFSDARNVYEMGGRLFRDNFDGDGHTISGLYINYDGTGRMNTASGMSSRTYCGWGLFPLVYGATFKNVKLKDVYIKSNVTAGSNAKGDYHGYGALVGNVHGSQPTTFENVQVENVQFDIARPNGVTGSKPVGVGGIIGYSYGALTVTDAIVKNVKVSFKNYYCTSRSVGYAGAVVGAVGYGQSVTATNVITVGAMNPLARSVGSSSSGGAVTIQSENTTKDIVTNLEASINATNCYAIGAISVHDVSGMTLVADEATFISDNLDTFYANKGASTNWAAKKAGKMARLASYSPYGDVLKCDFSNYTTKADYSNSPNAGSNWTVETDGETGNKYLRGDLTSVSNAADYAFTITPNYAIGNGSSHTGYYQWGMNGVIEPGTVYKLQFKAKCDETRTMKYTILNGYSYSAGNNNRGEHLVGSAYDIYTNAYLNTDWQTYTTYFTGEYYLNDGGQGTNRPIFQVNYGAMGGHYLYVDDIVISKVSGVSFKVSDGNTYIAPFIGDEGDAITLPEVPAKEGYVFGGWYTDAGCTTAFNSSTMKVGDVDILYAKWNSMFASHSLVLTDAVGVNFFMNLDALSAEEKAASYMTFDVAGVTKTAAFDSTFTGNGGTYGFTCYVNSVQMAEDITPTFHYAGNTLTGDAYAVKDYIDYVVANSGSFTAETVTLVKAIGDYGHYAQDYLGPKNSWVAGTDYVALAKYRAADYGTDDYTAKSDAIDALAKDIYATGVTPGNGSGQYRYTLNFDSRTSLIVKIFYDAAITVNTTYAGTIARDVGTHDYDLYLANIPISQFGDDIVVDGIVDGTGYSITLSGLSYVHSVLSSGLSAAAKNAVSALYDYYTAAVAYQASL